MKFTVKKLKIDKILIGTCKDFFSWNDIMKWPEDGPHGFKFDRLINQSWNDDLFHCSDAWWGQVYARPFGGEKSVPEKWEPHPLHALGWGGEEEEGVLFLPEEGEKVHCGKEE